MAAVAVLVVAVVAGRRLWHRVVAWLHHRPALLHGRPVGLVVAGGAAAVALAALAVALAAIAGRRRRGHRRRAGGGSRGARSRRPPQRRGRPEGAGTARWASGRELAPLHLGPGAGRSGGGEGSGRVVLGTLGRRRLALERGHSLLVVGPTQSGKTSGLAVPAILEWDGPVVATSVKTDLVAATRVARERRGRVAVYDPVQVAGCARASWSPLALSTSWAGARQAAAGLCAVARTGAASGLEDGGFWYATAEKLLAPLLRAAVCGGASMTDVVRWVDTGEVGEVVLALELAGEVEALQAAMASFGREDRARSSVYTTAETVLAAFADPLVAACSSGDDVDVGSLLGGGADTLYLVAPAHEQERLQAPFVCLLRSVLDGAFTRAARAGAPLDPPLLVVLDEAANVAPLAGLDGLVATAASHGVQVVTLWQDLAQVAARYGGRAATVVNNHRAKLFCPGVSDPATLEQVSRLVGDTEVATSTTTTEPGGARSTTTGFERRPLAPADVLRRLAPGEAVLLYADLLPARLALRPYYADPALRALAAGSPAAPRRRSGGRHGCWREGRPGSRRGSWRDGGRLSGWRRRRTGRARRR